MPQYYYVRPDGDDNNAGTGYLAGQAWRTISKALSSMPNGIDTGCICYVAPGFYAEQLTASFTPNAGHTYVIQGDPQCEKFIDITPGDVIVSGSNSLHTQAVRPCAVDFAGYYWWNFINITFYPGTSSTITNSPNTQISISFDNCVIVGKILNIHSWTEMYWQGCELIATTLTGSKLIKLTMSVLHCLTATDSALKLVACHANIGQFDITSASNALWATNSVINLYPSTPTGIVVKDAAAYINFNWVFELFGCTVRGVGKYLELLSDVSIDFQGNDVHNLDSFVKKLSTTIKPTNFNKNTYDNCKTCLNAPNSNSIITNLQSSNSNFIHCDSIANGYVALNTTCVQAYGGRITGTGASSTINSFRLPYASELTGVQVVSSSEIPGFSKVLKFRGHNGNNGGIVFWIPVEEGVTRTVHITFKNSRVVTYSQYTTILFGIIDGEIDITSTTSAVQTLTASYKSLTTGYVPLFINVKGGELVDDYCLIGNVAWS